MNHSNNIVWSGTEEEFRGREQTTTTNSAICVLHCADDRVIVCEQSELPLHAIPLLQGLLAEQPTTATHCHIPLSGMDIHSHTLELCLRCAWGHPTQALFEDLSVHALIEVARVADSLLMVQLMVKVGVYLRNTGKRLIQSTMPAIPLSMYALLVALQPAMVESIVSTGALSEDVVNGAAFRELIVTQAENAGAECPSWFSLWIRAGEPGWPSSDTLPNAENVRIYARCAACLLVARGLSLCEQLWLYTLIYNTCKTEGADECFFCFKEAARCILAEMASQRGAFFKAVTKLRSCFRYLENYSLATGTLMNWATEAFENNDVVQDIIVNKHCMRATPVPRPSSRLGISGGGEGGVLTILWRINYPKYNNCLLSPCELQYELPKNASMAKRCIARSNKRAHVYVVGVQNMPVMQHFRLHGDWYVAGTTEDKNREFLSLKKI